MNGYREDNNPHCYFHPKALVVGICALCLRERLLELAAKQEQHGPAYKDSSSNRFFRTLSRPPVITLPKVFALGSFLHLLDHSRHPRSKDDHDEDGSVGSLEDSFISIKFEDNGRASWNQKATGVDAAVAAAAGARNGGGGGGACPAMGTSGKEASKSVVELPKRSAGALRWRKRIGHLLQLARWKRSNKAVSLEGGGGGSGKGMSRRSWMRSLTRRRTTTTAATTTTATTATSAAFAVAVD